MCRESRAFRNGWRDGVGSCLTRTVYPPLIGRIGGCGVSTQGPRPVYNAAAARAPDEKTAPGNATTSSAAARKPVLAMKPKPKPKPRAYPPPRERSPPPPPPTASSSSSAAFSSAFSGGGALDDLPAVSGGGGGFGGGSPGGVPEGAAAPQVRVLCAHLQIAKRVCVIEQGWVRVLYYGARQTWTLYT